MIQKIKKEFFAYRNGIVADTLRKAGMPYKVIFGLQVPQLAEIARQIKSDNESAEAQANLAYQLWADSTVRESRLLATYLFPVEQTDMELAEGLCAECQTQEEADMLAFRLLKRLPFATELLEKLPPEGYAARALKNHLA